MSTTKSIKSTLVTQLQTVVGLPALATEGVKYERKANVPFVRFTLLPAETQNNSIGENYILQLNGLAQFDVFYPAARGVDEAETTAEAIVDALSPAILMDGGEQVVLTSVWINPIREEQSWVHIPVVARWFAFRNK